MRVILRLQHLMLPDIGDGDRVAAGMPPDVVDDLRGQQYARRLIIQDVALA